MKLFFYDQADLAYTAANDSVPHCFASYRHKPKQGEQITLYLVEGENQGTTFWKVGLTKESDPLKRARKNYTKVLATRTIVADHFSDDDPKGNVPAIEGFVCGKCRMLSEPENREWWDQLGSFTGASEAFIPPTNPEQTIERFHQSFKQATALIDEHGLRRYHDEHHFVWIYRAALKFGPLMYWSRFEPKENKREWRKLLDELLAGGSVS